LAPGFGVTPGVGSGGSGCCDVGSDCCASSPGTGVIVGPGVDPSFGMTAPGASIGVGGGGDCCAGGPGVACGGAGSSCCEPAGAMVTSTGWAFVGAGNGDFSPQSASYNYVGMGAGSYTKEVTTSFYGWKLRPCCIALLCLLLLLPLLWLLLPKTGGTTESVPSTPQVQITTPPAPAPVLPAPPPPPAAPSTPVGVCTVFGDPHVLTFDQMRADYYSPGEYWIVKSSKIAIQGRYLPTRMTSGLACAKVLALGGPLLKGHKIFVSSTTATFDGKPILTTFNSQFNVAGVVEMQYNGVGVLLQKGRQGKALHVVHIKIFDGTPEGIVIQVNRWNEPSEGHYINIRISMHPQPGQDGHCGNFNGNAADDDRVQVRSRLGKVGVPVGELLFKTKTPVVQANRPNINDCEASKLDSAKAICKRKEGKLIPSLGCLVDICFGGKGFAQEG